MKWLKNSIITLLAFVVVGMFAMFALNLSFLNPIAQVVKDFEMTDIYYQILQDTDDGELSEDVTIVDMTELYSRRELADALDAIEAENPRTVGVDVVFEGLKEDSVGDDMMREVAESYRNIVFSYKLLEYENDTIGYGEAVHSFFVTDSLAEGFTNMQRNLYGGMKRVLSLGRKYQGETVPSFITMVASHYSGKELSAVEERDLDINFMPRRFHVLQSDSVAHHPEWIRDRLVLFGAMKDEQDMHYTPLGKMAGVELLAYSVETLLEQSEVNRLNGWMTSVISFLLVLLTQVVFAVYKDYAKGRKNRFWRFLLMASFVRSILMFLWIAVWMWVAFILFCKYGVSLNLGWALSAMAFLSLAQSIYEECLTAINDKNNEKKIVNSNCHHIGDRSEQRTDGSEETKSEVGLETHEAVCEVCSGQGEG